MNLPNETVSLGGYSGLSEHTLVRGRGVFFATQNSKSQVLAKFPLESEGRVILAILKIPSPGQIFIFGGG